MLVCRSNPIGVVIIVVRAFSLNNLLRREQTETNYYLEGFKNAQRIKALVLDKKKRWKKMIFFCFELSEAKSVNDLSQFNVECFRVS